MVVRLGVDIGFGFVKALLEEHRFLCPSVISPVDSLKMEVVQPGTEGKQSLIALHDGGAKEVFRMGEDAICQGYASRSTLHASRTRTREFSVLFQGTLGMLLRDHRDPLSPETPLQAMVVTGLPVTEYGDREWLEAEFQRRHEIAVNNEVVIVDILRVCAIPQPFGTYFDLAVRSDGGDPRLLAGMVGIVDIGYLTTDLIAVHDRQYVPRLSTSIQEGMSSIYRRCGQILAGHYRLDVNERNVEFILRDGVQHMGTVEQVDQDLVAHVFAEFAEMLRSRMVTIWGKEALKTLIISGGGGVALERHLRHHFPQILMPDDPQWSNVRGFKKFCQYLSK